MVVTPYPRVQAPPLRVLPHALPRVQLTVDPNIQPVYARTRSCQTPSTLKTTTSPDGPVAHRTRSRNIEEALTINPAQSSQRKYPSELIDLGYAPLPLDLAAMPFLDRETGKTLEF